MVSSITVHQFSLAYHLSGSFIIPDDYLEYFDKYYLLHWRGGYIIKQLGTTLPRFTQDISRQDVIYHPIMLGDCKFIDPNRQYKVSFRRLRGYPEGIALITPKKL